MSERFVEIESGFFVNRDYKDALADKGLASIDAVFEFQEGQDLHKDNLASHRSRACFQLPSGPVVYLKRYNQPPISVQKKNRRTYGRPVTCCDLDRLPGEKLQKAGILTPKVIAWGSEWENGQEKRSFVMTEEIPGISLEKRLPECITNLNPLEKVTQRRDFIKRLAEWVRRFHDTGLRHRDLYLCHIFLTDQDELYLIDLHRTFRPKFLSERYRLKDLTQLYYSAPGNLISGADRLRFYQLYTGRKKLTLADKWKIRSIKRKAWRMADHDIKHGRPVPFAQ